MVDTITIYSRTNFATAAQLPRMQAPVSRGQLYDRQNRRMDKMVVVVV